MMEIGHGLITFGIFILVILQIAVVVILQRVYADRTVERVGKMLHEQNERLALALHDSIEKATTAAKEAYTEANNTNTKISNLNERILDQQSKKK